MQWRGRREVGAGAERQRGGREDREDSEDSGDSGHSDQSPVQQHCSQAAREPRLASQQSTLANIMEAFGDESYVGIKEMTMDMKVKLRGGESDMICACDDEQYSWQLHFKTIDPHCLGFWRLTDGLHQRETVT